MYIDYSGSFPVPIEYFITGIDHTLGLYKFLLDRSIKGLKPKRISLDLAKKLLDKEGTYSLLELSRNQYIIRLMM